MILRRSETTNLNMQIAAHICIINSPETKSSYFIDKRIIESKKRKNKEKGTIRDRGCATPRTRAILQIAIAVVHIGTCRSGFAECHK